MAWLNCAGLLVPSVRHSGTNLVIFPNVLATNDEVKVESQQDYEP